MRRAAIVIRVRRICLNCELSGLYRELGLPASLGESRPHRIRHHKVRLPVTVTSSYYDYYIPSIYSILGGWDVIGLSLSLLWKARQRGILVYYVSEMPYKLLHHHQALFSKLASAGLTKICVPSCIIEQERPLWGMQFRIMPQVNLKDQHFIECLSALTLRKCLWRTQVQTLLS